MSNDKIKNDKMSNEKMSNDKTLKDKTHICRYIKIVDSTIFPTLP
jgi:hypothetical protein